MRKILFILIFLVTTTDLHAQSLRDADIDVFKAKMERGCHTTADGFRRVLPMEDLNEPAVCQCVQDKFSAKLRGTNFDYSHGLTPDLFKQADSLAVDALIECFKAPLARAYEQKMTERCLGELSKDTPSIVPPERRSSHCACTGAGYAKSADLGVLKTLPTQADRDRQVQIWYKDSFDACLRQ